MAFTAKRLAQATLSTTLTAIYTAPTGKTAQAVEIWFANNNASTIRNVAVNSPSNAAGNVLIPKLPIAPLGFQVYQSIKIILVAGESIYASQDAGADVVMTVYGGEE